jgi:repressor LexA
MNATDRQMTPKQFEVFQAIRNWVTEHGHPPTLRELARHLDRRPFAIQKHLRSLAAKKWIKLVRGECRGIEILKEPLARTQMLMFGEISAGCPVEAIQQYDLVDFRDLFDHYAMALEVADDAGEPKGLRRGDYLVWVPGRKVGMIRLVH